MLRALDKFYIEHSFITENKADDFLSDIPVIGERDMEPQFKFNNQLFTDPESDLGSLVPNRPSLSINDYNRTFTDSQRRAFEWITTSLTKTQTIRKPILP